MKAILIAAALSAGFVTIAAAATDVPVRGGGVVGPYADAMLTTEIKAKLFDEQDLRRSFITVTVLDAVVTLAGSASSRQAKAVAEASVRSVEGVLKVNDELSISAHNQAATDAREAIARTESGFSDSWITTKVKSAIIADARFAGFDVNVNTTRGVVALTGVLDDQSIIDQVKAVAARVSGVRRVNTAALSVAGS